MLLILALFNIVFERSQRDKDDILILKRIMGGEESAMAEFYGRYSQLLYTFGLRMLRSSEEVQDLLQEVFLQVWNKAAAYEKDKGTVYTWLVTMTRNRAIDIVRSKGYKHRSRSVDINTIDLVSELSASNPHSVTVAGEDQQTVVNALKRLTSDQRQVIALAYYEGYSQTEIASSLGIPLGTVKSRIRKGLIEMRAVLKVGGAI